MPRKWDIESNDEVNALMNMHQRMKKILSENMHFHNKRLFFSMLLRKNSIFNGLLFLFKNNSFPICYRKIDSYLSSKFALKITILYKSI